MSGNDENWTERYCLSLRFAILLTLFRTNTLYKNIGLNKRLKFFTILKTSQECSEVQIQIGIRKLLQYAFCLLLLLIIQTEFMI